MEDQAKEEEDDECEKVDRCRSLLNEEEIERQGQDRRRMSIGSASAIQPSVVDVVACPLLAVRGGG